MLTSVRETVERLLLVVDGTFARSPGLRLVDEITDDLLIEIRKDVISAGNAAQPKPLSGLAQQKVMLWVVIDAVRSPVVLSGADLSRAAGRIWKQAARVSEALSVTAKEHAYRRDAARAAAAADQGLAAGLPMQLAAISAAEEERCDKLRREVYEGLTELAAAPDDAPAPALIEPPKPHNTAITTLSSTGVRYPHAIPYLRPAELEVPAIPADLVAQLNRDTVQRLFSDYSTHMEGSDPEDWSTWLPSLVNKLTRELASDRALYERRLDDAAHQLRTAGAIRDVALEELRACEIESDDLNTKLVRSEAKVEVLSEVLSRKNA